MNVIIIGAVTLLAGVVVGYLSRQVIAKNQLDTAESKVTKLLEEAKINSKETLLNAKDEAVKILDEAKKEEKKRREELRGMEKRFEQKEQGLDQKVSNLEKERKNIEGKANEIKRIREEILQVKNQQIEKLERISGMNKEEAKRALIKITEKENKDEIVKVLGQLEKDKKEQLEEEAKNMMSFAMQRYAGSHAAETTTSTVALPSDEIKGRIIGREGRNIKALEALTGVEVIVDDTPEAIVISGFDPMRREIARMALTYLIEDGRIHPTKIEDSVEKAKKEINKKIKEAGEAAVYDLGLAGIDPRLIQLLGKLRYRTSYGQNVLLHSLEVAHISGALAGELGIDITKAKKAGLFHDIGKAVDHEIQGTHIDLGVNILRKLGQSEDIIDAMKSHHEDYPFKNNLGLIIAAADALSASRPGARKDTLEKYLRRLEELETLVLSYSEVQRCYAIQAGREVRVFVSPEKIDDLEALKLAKNIAQRIEEELNYPGEIKVNVIRETRSVEYAR
ncbi:MAG: ribonuclease Y [Patescibacteria group bacterium]|jgi:ribonuclease Y|nr:ribonuclease Y [Patescibacteria group bacterium]